MDAALGLHYISTLDISTEPEQKCVSYSETWRYHIIN